MNIEKEFPARYWINLGRRQDRRVEMEYQLELAGIRAERFPAVDARFVKRNRGYESAGRDALALSQRLAIRKAMLEGAEAVLVMEDDVVFHPELAQRLEEIALPEDWGIFYLGCAHRWPPKAVSDGLVKVRYALDTHAFAVRAPYYKRVMSALSLREDEAADHPLASDWFLADLHGEIPTYACFPNMAWQAATDSDLAGGVYSNYTENGEQKWGGEELHGVQAAAWGGTRWSGWKRPAPEVTDPKMGLLFLTRGNERLSVEVLGWMIAGEGFWEGFDVVFIDGSHLARNVMTDATMSWHLLKPGGMSAFDDYQWGVDRPVTDRPLEAINAFLAACVNELYVVWSGVQMVVRKRVGAGCPDDGLGRDAPSHEKSAPGHGKGAPSLEATSAS